jgi:hypothetical protein
MVPHGEGGVVMRRAGGGGEGGGETSPIVDCPPLTIVTMSSALDFRELYTALKNDGAGLEGGGHGDRGKTPNAKAQWAREGRGDFLEHKSAHCSHQHLTA